MAAEAAAADETEYVAENYRNSVDPAYRDQIFGWMLAFIDRIVETTGFYVHIDVETLERLLGSVVVQARPDMRIGIIMKWVLHDQPCRNCYLGRLLLCVPGALMDREDIENLLYHADDISNREARYALEDMLKEHLPYHVSSEGVALGLKSICGGGTKVFRFELWSGVGYAEFMVTVEATDGMGNVKVRLAAGRVGVPKSAELPTSVTARVAMRLCCEDGSGQLREKYVVEEDGICLVKDAWPEPWVRRFNVDPWEMARVVNMDKGCTLYVQVKEMTINGTRYSLSAADGIALPALPDGKIHHPLNAQNPAVAMCAERCACGRDHDVSQLPRPRVRFEDSAMICGAREDTGSASHCRHAAGRHDHPYFPTYLQTSSRGRRRRVRHSDHDDCRRTRHSDHDDHRRSRYSDHDDRRRSRHSDHDDHRRPRHSDHGGDGEDWWCGRAHDSPQFEGRDRDSRRKGSRRSFNRDCGCCGVDDVRCGSKRCACCCSYYALYGWPSRGG